MRIIGLCLIECLPTNQEVGSSNLSGRATGIKKAGSKPAFFIPARIGLFWPRPTEAVKFDNLAVFGQVGRHRAERGGGP